MGLSLYYKEDDKFIEVSVDIEDGLEPLTSIHDGKKGSVITRQLYVRNDDSALWYSNVIVQPLDLVDADPYGDTAYNETGWGIKMSESISEPSIQEWEDINWGLSITLDDFGSDSGSDTTTYVPFWYYETCPPNEDAQVKTDIVINVSYTENAIV